MFHRGGTEKELERFKEKTSTLGEDVTRIFHSGWHVFACCAAQDPEKSERGSRRREERVPHFQARLGERTDRRGKAILPVVGVGIVLNHTSRRGRTGLFVQELVDGPARSSGMIAVGDQLLSIDRHDVEASRIEDLSYLLPGPEGSEVVLRFREESGENKTVTLVRSLPSSFDHFPRYSSVSSMPTVPATRPPHAAMAGQLARLGLNGSPPQNNNTAGPLVGVGIEFAENKAGNNIHVSAILPGSPAFESDQICVADVLIGVDGKDVASCSLMALARDVLGLPDTPITLTFRAPADPGQVKHVTLRRRAADTSQLPRPESPFGLEYASYSA